MSDLDWTPWAGQNVLEYQTGSWALKGGKKDLVMKTQGRFRPEFKRQVIEELLSGISSAAQIIRRYEISSGLLYHWKE